MFPFYGYLFPTDGQSYDQQRANCELLALRLGGKIETFIPEVDDDPEDRDALVYFIQSTAERYRGKTLLVPTARSILDSDEVCSYLYDRLLDAADMSAIFGERDDAMFEEYFWHHVDDMKVRIKARHDSCREINVENTRKKNTAKANAESLLDDMILVAKKHPVTSQQAIAYILYDLDNYKNELGDDQEKAVATLQRRISRALKLSPRRQDFIQILERNRKNLGKRR